MLCIVMFFCCHVFMKLFRHCAVYLSKRSKETNPLFNLNQYLWFMTELRSLEVRAASRTSNSLIPGLACLQHLGHGKSRLAYGLL